MNAKQKAARILRAERHREMDLLTSGRYVIRRGNTWKGCSVGCDAVDIDLANGVALANINDTGCHARVAEHDGTVEWVEVLRDNVFESILQERKGWWHVELAKALPDEEQRKAKFGTTGWLPYVFEVWAAVLERTIQPLDRREFVQPPEFLRTRIQSLVAAAIDCLKSPTFAKRAAVFREAVAVNIATGVLNEPEVEATTAVELVLEMVDNYPQGLTGCRTNLLTGIVFSDLLGIPEVVEAILQAFSGEAPQPFEGAHAD